jgi:5-methylcytosine-specific restriction protein A
VKVRSLAQKKYKRMRYKAAKKCRKEECELCGAPRECVHHIHPLSAGGSNKRWNLMPLCLSCHNRIHEV